jgi:hypothetical protein
MKLKQLFESIFFENQLSNTIVLVLKKKDQTEDLTSKMDQLKSLLNSMGISLISFVPETGSVTIVATPDKEQDVLKLAQDFGADVSFNGFDNTGTDNRTLS